MKHLLPLMTLTLCAQLACNGPVTQNGAGQTTTKKPAAAKSRSYESAPTEETDDGSNHSDSTATKEPTSDETNVSSTSQAGPLATSTPLTPSTVQNSKIVEFRIKAGTGNGPWNDEASRINVKVGQELHIINDDDRAHLMHTNGAPFFHPFLPIAAGGKAVYKIASPLANETLYDHLTKGKIFINAER